MWKNQDQNLLDCDRAATGAAQHYVTGYATQAYIKCNAEQIFFAGPQRERLVVASADDGHLLWQKTPGNLQLVLRDDGFYCVGPQQGADDAGAQVLVRRPAAGIAADAPRLHACHGERRQHFLSRRRRHGARQYGVEHGRAHCADAAALPGRRDHLRRAAVLGTLDVRVPVVALRPRLPGAGRTRHVGRAAVEPQLQQYTRANARPPAALDASPATGRRSGTTFVAQQLHAGQCAGIGAASCGRVSCRPANCRPPRSWPAGWTFVADRSGVGAGMLNEQGQIAMDDSARADRCTIRRPIADGRLFVGSADGRVYALEAATGRLLWSYRVAPQARWMPVYGKLISTWPVAGGVRRGGRRRLCRRRDRSLRRHIRRGAGCGDGRTELAE